MSTAAAVMARSARTGILLVALASVLWGTSSIAAKTLMLHADATPLGVGFWRLALSVPPLLVLGWLTLGRGLFRLSRKAVPLVAVTGLAMAFYQVFFYAAVARAGVTVTSLVALCGAPVVVAVLSSVLLREPPGARTLLALALAVGGTVMLVGVPDGDAGTQVLLGALLASGAAASYATVVIAGRSMAGTVHPYQTIIIGFGGGALCLLPFAAAAGIGVSDVALGVPLLIYLGVVTTGLSYVLFFTGMKTTPATAASIVTLLEALTATLLAWLLFGERLGPLGMVGGVLLVAAMLILTLRRRTD